MPYSVVSNCSSFLFGGEEMSVLFNLLNFTSRNHPVKMCTNVQVNVCYDTYYTLKLQDVFNA